LRINQCNYNAKISVFSKVENVANNEFGRFAGRLGRVVHSSLLNQHRSSMGRLAWKAQPRSLAFREGLGGSLRLE
jgi:hypothetical protein